MIEVDPEAAVELLDARDFYEQRRPGLGAVFELAAQTTLDAIESAPQTFPKHPFATTAGVRRARFIGKPSFPYALAFMMHPAGHAYVLAAEHLRRAPVYWLQRLAGRR
jgi:hypothetical protein